jgi:hydrogenase maturation protease
MAEQRKSLTLKVPVLTRVEGEGALDLRIRDGNIEELKLRIFEPPRFFEKFLEGRHYSEVPDIVARICGICPVAYQMTAVQALEKLFGVEAGPWARDMRRVFYCGEWIQSHALHIHLLAAPDFFGCNSAIELARIHPEVVRRGLHLQAVGNEIMELFGARSVHPVGLRVGGFHHAPTKSQAEALRQKLHDALPQAEELVRWAASIPLPNDNQPFISVALRHETGYAIEAGQIAASDGLNIGAPEYDAHFAEYQQPHSTALFSAYHKQPYLVGPLARLNLNHTQLPENIRHIIAETGLSFPNGNVFTSMAARAVEILFAIQEAARLLENYQVSDSPHALVKPKAGIAHGATEAPRGLLWHRYEVDDAGIICNARIVPPTSQNQARIEEDLRLSLLNFGLDHEDDALRLHCEKVIRNYDPCISCATHFLRMNVERSSSRAGIPSRRTNVGKVLPTYESLPAIEPANMHPSPAGRGEMKKIRIIGIGSPSGDDQIGWRVVDALKDRLPPEFELIKLDRPGTGLIQLLENTSHVILIDAMQGGGAHGAIRHFSNDEWTNYQQGLSSHGVGVFDALMLVKELGALPETIELYGIEIGTAMPGESSSRAVMAAAENLADTIANLVGLNRR